MAIFSYYYDGKCRLCEKILVKWHKKLFFADFKNFDSFKLHNFYHTIFLCHNRKRGLRSPLSRRTRTWLSYQRTEYPCLRLCEIDWIRIEYPWIEYYRDIHRFTNTVFKSTKKAIWIAMAKIEHSVQNYIHNLEKNWAMLKWLSCKEIELAYLIEYSNQESRREGWTDARSAVGFCLGSGLFGSYNSD